MSEAQKVERVVLGCMFGVFGPPSLTYGAWIGCLEAHWAGFVADLFLDDLFISEMGELDLADVE